MLEPFVITTRDFLRQQKVIFQKIKTTKRPAIVVKQKRPQVAIVNLQDLDSLKGLKFTKALLDIAHNALKINGPKDLSKNLNKYAWSK